MIKKGFECLFNYLMWIAFYDILLMIPYLIQLVIFAILRLDFSYNSYAIICPPVIFVAACVLALKMDRPLFKKEV